MSCFVLRYCIAIAVMIFVCLPIEIGCCSMSTDDVVTLMFQNADFESDPCYTKWKAAQDAKISELWSRHHELEESAHEYHRRKTENKPVKRVKRSASLLDMYPNIKNFTIWEWLVYSMGVMVLFCACMACGASAYNNQDAFESEHVHAPTLASRNSLEYKSVYNDNFRNLSGLPGLPLYGRMPPMTPISNIENKAWELREIETVV